MRFHEIRSLRIGTFILMTGLVLVSSFGGAGHAQALSDDQKLKVRNDAYALLTLIEDQFAYRDQFEGGLIPVRAELESQIPFLNSRNDLIAFSQRAFHSLQDHHSITGSGLQDAYGLVPSFADLWIEKVGDRFLIEDVRKGSPALKAGVRPGCELNAIDGQSIADSIQTFVGPTGTAIDERREAYVARVLATGRRDRIRRLGLTCEDLSWTIELPNLYQARLKRDPGLVAAETRVVGQQTIGIVRFNDSLGLSQTIEAFDEAVNEFGAIDALVIDLRDTASGGNTLVARGILSRFVRQPSVYQRHILPNEERVYGVSRSWLEEVHPRGAQISVPTGVLVGRWTASMGEGLAIGFDALGVPVYGSRMAGLLGGITDHRLPETGILVKLTTEQLAHVNGTPREDFVPPNAFLYADAPGVDGGDTVLEAALSDLTKVDLE